jgi:hypothetical protein
MAGRGQPKTGGRKAGTPNKQTIAKDRVVREAIARLQVGSGSFAGDGYALLAAIYKSEDFDLPVRMDAAKAATAYERPRLANVAMTTKSLDEMTAEEVLEFREQLKSFIAQSRANAAGDRADSAESGDAAPPGELLN